ncbi:MAG: tetratricopeptide repeat protein [Elusimicrobia bacterium]|nr:tetratricopeptide repeat protein [Elusimicrobiota bacterium]
MFTIRNNISDAPAESRFFTGLTPYVCLLLLISVVYAHAVFFGFSYLDDNNLILDNFHFLGDLSNFFKAFQRDVFGAANEFYYRPLMTISLMIDARFGGTAPWAYHLTNILIHSASSCLLLVLLRRLGCARFPSFLCSAFFAVHPALCQAVAWIPGRNDSLLALFILPAFIFFIDYAAQRKTLHLALHLLFFLLALLTKETALVLLVLCPLYMLLIARKRIFEPRNLPVFIGWTAAACGWFILRKAAFLHPVQYAPEYMLRSFFTNLPAVMLYTGKFLFPFNLSVLPILRDNTPIYGYIASALIFMLLYCSKNADRKRAAFGLLWFLLFLLPGFLRPNSDLPADFIEHRMYVPALGFILLLLETNAVKNLVFGKNPGTFLAGLILVLFSVINVFYSANFKNSYNFWNNAVTHSPEYHLTQCNFGLELAMKGDLTHAIEHYQEALKLNPAYPDAHNNLGIALAKQGKFEQAVLEYREALRLNPYLAETHDQLGLALSAQGKVDEAVAHYREALRLKPDDVEVHNNWGLALSAQGKTEEAIAHYREALRLKPDLAPVHNNWGMTLAYSGRMDEAIQHFREALKILPNYATARTNLNTALKVKQKSHSRGQ